jgi:hypothetical protein
MFVGYLVGDKSLSKVIVVLVVCLAISLFFDGYFYWKLAEENSRPMHHSTFFSFVFGPSQQNISAGNIYLNLTFDTVEGNLTVKAEVNAENYNPNSFLTLQFDSDNNGTIDIPQLYYFYGRCDLQFFLQADNQTLLSMSPSWDWDANGKIYFGYMLILRQSWFKSTFHFCTYSNGIYVFRFTFPIRPMEIAPFGSGYGTSTLGIQGRLVRALFGIAPLGSMEPAKGMTVYVPPFNFME